MPDSAFNSNLCLIAMAGWRNAIGTSAPAINHFRLVGRPEAVRKKGFIEKI